MGDAENTQINQTIIRKESKTHAKSRRQMAWLALISMLMVTYCALFKVSPERLKVLSEVITWFYFTMASIVGSYVGFSAYLDMKSPKKGDD